jgi:hypothetical protein
MLLPRLFPCAWSKSWISIAAHTDLKLAVKAESFRDGRGSPPHSIPQALESTPLPTLPSPEIPPIQRPVLHRFCDVSCLQLFAAREISDGARDLENPVVGSGGEA